MKKTFLKNLPKGFKCSISKDGLIVNVWAKLDEVGGFDEANKAVKKFCKQFNLDLIDDGIYITTMEQNWTFIDLNVECTMHNEAKSVLNHMKSFFKKYGNRYCESSKTYDVIESMRNLIATDEA